MNLINKSFIFTDVQVASRKKEEALRVMGEMIAEHKKDAESMQIINGFTERESLSTTGFGNGIAMPHAKLDAIEPCLAIFKFAHSVQWEALDGQPVDTAFAILAPNESESNIHLQIISSLARKMMNKQFVAGLQTSQSVDELYHYLKEQL